MGKLEAYILALSGIRGLCQSLTYRRWQRRKMGSMMYQSHRKLEHWKIATEYQDKQCGCPSSAPERYTSLLMPRGIADKLGKASIRSQRHRPRRKSSSQMTCFYSKISSL